MLLGRGRPPEAVAPLLSGLPETTDRGRLLCAGFASLFGQLKLPLELLKTYGLSPRWRSTAGQDSQFAIWSPPIPNGRRWWPVAGPSLPPPAYSTAGHLAVLEIAIRARSEPMGTLAKKRGVRGSRATRRLAPEGRLMRSGRDQRVRAGRRWPPAAALDYKRKSD